MSVRRAPAHVPVRPVDTLSPAVSHADRLKALQSYIPKRKARGGAAAQRVHVLSIGADVVQQMAAAESETSAMSQEDAREFWEVIELKNKIKTFLQDSSFTVEELSEVLTTIGVLQAKLLKLTLAECEARLAQREASSAEGGYKPFPTDPPTEPPTQPPTADDSYIPFPTEPPTQPPTQPLTQSPPKAARALRAVVAMLTAGSMLMAYMQSAEAQQPGQAFTAIPVNPDLSYFDF